MTSNKQLFNKRICAVHLKNTKFWSFENVKIQSNIVEVPTDFSILSFSVACSSQSNCICWRWRDLAIPSELGPAVGPDEPKSWPLVTWPCRLNFSSFRRSSRRARAFSRCKLIILNRKQRTEKSVNMVQQIYFSFPFQSFRRLQLVHELLLISNKFYICFEFFSLRI